MAFPGMRRRQEIKSILRRVVLHGATWLALRLNNLGALSGQTTNFLEDAAQGSAVYSASLASQPIHEPFPRGRCRPSAVVMASDSVQLLGVITQPDHGIA